MRIYMDGGFTVSARDDSLVFEDDEECIIVPWKSGMEAAQAIVAENHRRREEAEKQPREVCWHVSMDRAGGTRVSASSSPMTCTLPTFNSKGIVRGYDNGEMTFYILAEDGREARLKANEAAHSLRAWIREYLA